MRTVTAALALALLTSVAAGQSMEEKYQEKLKKDFVAKASWVQSLDKAKETAAAEGKLIFGYFSRSYAP
jgi:hypothetical protein